MPIADFAGAVRASVLALCSKQGQAVYTHLSHHHCLVLVAGKDLAVPRWALRILAHPELTFQKLNLVGFRASLCRLASCRRLLIQLNRRR